MLLQTSITREAVQEARTATKKQKQKLSPMDTPNLFRQGLPTSGSSGQQAQTLSDLSIQDLVKFIQDPTIKSCVYKIRLFICFSEQVQFPRLRFF